MATTDDPDPHAGEGHWGTKRPEDQPPRAAVLGLPRQVLESRLRLGDAATPAAVAAELRAMGLSDITEEKVREAWDKA